MTTTTPEPVCPFLARTDLITEDRHGHTFCRSIDRFLIENARTKARRWVHGIDANDLMAAPGSAWAFVPFVKEGSR